jgi:hypothetical protein
VTFAAKVIPDSDEVFGTGKAVKVSGTVDGHPHEASMLLIGGGIHMMSLPKRSGRTSATR